MTPSDLLKIRDAGERRKAARRMIVEAAGTRGRIGAGGRRTPHSMRTIQQAVFVVRQRRLLPPVVLETAGYRGAK